MKIDIRIIYESLSPVRSPKNFFDFIFPALGSTCHILDAQQVFVRYMYGQMDGWLDK